MAKNFRRPNRIRIHALAWLLLAGALALVGVSNHDQVHSAGPGPTSQTPAMTVILVRHAEKKIVPPENKDPDLSPSGKARAKELARMFGNSGITAIYATQFKRTQQTVKPLSDKTGIPVVLFEATKTPDLVAKIRAGTAGQIVFVAGHNNTVPEIIAALGGPQMPIIPESEFDNLFILTVDTTGTVRLLKMRYSAPAP